MDETKRLSLLKRYDILDTPPEAAFDHIVDIVARILDMPFSLVSFVDEARVWFKARHGMQDNEIVRLPGFCASAIEQDGPWFINDAATDPVCARHPWVTGDAQVRSYAGIPLKVPEGPCLGMLCAMDTKPRCLAAREREMLSELAALVVDKLISRSASKAALWEKDVAVGVAGELADQSRLLTAMVQSSQDAIITKDLAGRITSWNTAAERMFGFAEAEMMGQSGLRIIPSDRHAEEAFVLSSIADGQSVNHYETVRQHRSGRQIPISITVSPIRDDQDRVIGASKIIRDITDQKDSQSRIKALMKEVNHRVKNQYAIILSMLRQTGRTTQNQAEFEGRIRERIMALSRSHDLLVNTDWRGTTIEELVASQIEPFANRERVSSGGPPVLLSPSAAQYLGMALHELSIHSAEHGAMAQGDGLVDIRWSIDERDDGPWLRLSWDELDGPDVSHIVEGGFAQTILQRMAPDAVSGRGRIDSADGHLTWTIDAPLNSLS
ncbi:PAS domain S-box protein [Mesorhizobium australicum]|uniref:Blue-light-activated histidine kinase n=1 Tax=Mesorhizobium australicum TaxID=536018 RepID=A0A1X7N167_9HYPH|nr:PAS domain S-box protein [Mesorhizobium australicum]SMH30073.1 PAS domain S-box-containing protein [Mesorhizobium australicum]